MTLPIIPQIDGQHKRQTKLTKKIVRFQYAACREERKKRLPAWADSLCMVRISVCGLHELDDDHRSSIAAANAELEDTRVTALAVSVLACDLIEKLSYYIFISQLSDCLATSAEVTALCERDEVFSELAELFCLSFRRLNAAISEEGSENARAQRLAGCGVTS